MHCPNPVSILVATALALAAAPHGLGQCGGGGDCLIVHPQPGCTDADCCTTVCTTDPLCCSLGWDAECVGLADSLCVGLCGASASGDCLVPHATPACDRGECCATVCALDPYCCDFAWDFTCALLASLNCPPKGPGQCGDPSAGSCTVPHASAACDDLACCELVCAIDPSCCSQSWDFVCATVAQQYCVESCEPECPPNSVAEDEDCGQDSNNPCYLTPSPFPAVQPLACGSWVCGQIHSVTGGFRDIDVYAVTVPDDGDGDGTVAVRLSLASSFDGFAALVAAPCGPIASAVASVETDFCVEFASGVTCVSPGEYRLVVAAGTFPQPGNPNLICGQFGATRYRARLECLPTGCGPTCGPDAGSCFSPHKGPGCDDVECCDSVCVRDPGCCEQQWDTSCVQAAQTLCAVPPANDDCGGAIDVDGGSVEVSLIGATPSLPTFPPTCGGAATDVWYRVVAPRTATCTVTTCGSGTFDSVVAVYESCKGLPIACNDDATQCIPELSSRVSFAAACGDAYLVRVGSLDGTPGSATLVVNFGPGATCGCVADLDGDGSVGGSDLTMLLSAWSGPGGDLDGDGTTNGADLTVILSAWGPCP